jgi:hypothetical protein
MAYGEVEVLPLIFLTSALNGDEWLASRSGRLVLGLDPALGQDDLERP